MSYKYEPNGMNEGLTLRWSAVNRTFTPDSAKTKLDQFSTITNGVKLENKQHDSIARRVNKRMRSQAKCFHCSCVYVS